MNISDCVDISGSGVVTYIFQSYDVSQMIRVTPADFVISNVYYYRYSSNDALTERAVFLGKHQYGNPVFHTATNPPSIEFEIPTNWQFFTKTD